MTGRCPTPAALAVSAAALILPLGGCGGSSSTAPERTSAARPDVTLHASGHRPRVGKPWPITIVARDDAGRPLRAEVRYQYLFAGAVVAHRSDYRFRGVFHDVITWPARSEGVPLTFRAVVDTPLGRRNLDYDVRVRP